MGKYVSIHQTRQDEILFRTSSLDKEGRAEGHAVCEADNAGMVATCGAL